jgi:DNA-binding MarR family transcriptional regulator
VTERPRGRTRKPKPGDPVARVGLEIRRMGAHNVVMSKLVAARFGLNTTDLECLDLILMRGSASAGELARATGLTSGAMTAVIDRLERAGYVERVADPADRRRREVHILADAIKPIQAVYQPLQARMIELWSQFSERDLNVVIDFLSRSTDLGVACAAELQRKPAERRPPTRRAR